MATTPLPPPSTSGAIIYTPAEATDGKYKQPRTAPIAHFTSLPNDGIGNDSILKKSSSKEGIPSAGRLLAVNSSYIAYAVKKGLVRVIDRSSGAKTLLRGHDERTRMVDATFFGENGGGVKEGVGGVWEELGLLERQRNGGNGNNDSTGGVTATNNVVQPPVAASDVLATIGGLGDSSNVLIWRIHSNNANSALAADKLLEVQFDHANRLIWHPFNPNRFLLMHRTIIDDDKEEQEKEGGRTVATLVETTRLVTHAHATEGHMVWQQDTDSDDAADEVPGMTPLTVTDNNTSLAGAQDVTWSNTDAKHVLTGHADGFVRLWDLTPAIPTGGEEGEEAAPATAPTTSIPCVQKLNVAAACTTMENNSNEKGVTRVIFLSQYQDSQTTNHAMTPPFVTGTNANHTVTLWSSFASSSEGIAMPSRLRVFGLRSDGIDSMLSSMMSMELIPAPYRPPLADDDESTTVPSSFVLLADRKIGILHALHLDTEWKDGKDDAADNATSAVTVKGFDHVTTLNVVHPIYSYCVAPSSSVNANVDPVYPPGMANMALKEERHVDLCCIQSKAVQMLTLSAEMCVAPTVGNVGDLAPGVSLVDLPQVVPQVIDDEEEEEENYEDFEEKELAEEEFEEDYDMEEEEGAEYSTTNDSDEDDDDGDDAMPAPVASEPNAFSNWLGAIANPLPPPTAAATSILSSAPVIGPASTSVPPPGLPPGLGFSSILSPPPGMLAAAAPVIVAAPAPAPKADISMAPPQPSAPPVPPLASTMAFLSPMEILSGSASGGDLLKPEPPKKQQKEPVKSTSPVPVPVMAPPVASVVAPVVAPAPKVAAKKSTKKQNKKAASSASPSTQPSTAAPVMKILQREDPKEEAARSSILPPHSASKSSSAVANNAAVDLTAIETTVRRTITNQIKAHETQLLTSLRKIIATEVSQAIAKSSSSLKDKETAADKNKNIIIEQVVSRGIASGLEHGLGQSLDSNNGGKLGKRMEKHAKDSAALAAKEAVDKMQVPIMNSLHQTMREVMIPAYEAASRQMFQQTSTSLEQGLAQMSVSMNQTNNASTTALQAMETQMMKMNEVISSLSAEVVQLRGAVNAVSSSGGNQHNNGNLNQQAGSGGSVLSQQQQQESTSMGIRNEIMALCQAQRYEEMFSKAIAAVDGDFVLFACKNTDSAKVFNGVEVILSQPILICLMQQLGAVLVPATDAGDIKTILNWLQEIAVTIDPTNVNIQPHVERVVHTLLANINNKMSNCDPAFRRPLQTLMQVSRGLL